MDKNIVKQIVDIMIRQNIDKALNNLGIEGTLQAIENIVQPILRAKLREKSLNHFGDNNSESVYRRILRKHGYQFTQVIGKGGMSRVDEVREIETGQLKAIKHLGNSLPPEKVERFRKILRRETEYAFDHPNVLKGDSYFEDGGDVFYVMPRMQHNLDHLLLDDRQITLTPS